MTSERLPAGWLSAKYGDAMIETDERAGDRMDLPVLSVTKTRGPMLASERFGKALHTRDVSRYRVARRDVIVADPMLLWDGSIGIQRVVDAGLVSPDYRVYAPSGRTDPAFLAYVVRSPTMLPHYQGGARGTNVRRNRIARGDFLSIPLALPPLPEQRKIAAILSCMDDAIETTQAVIDQLGVLKKATMAELLMRGMPGRHARFKQTEIGEVPERWDVLPLGALANIGNGSTPSKARPDYWNQGVVPWLPTGKVNDRIIVQAEEFVTQKALAECAIRLLPKGTILVAMIGQGKTRGKVAYLGIEATINQNFAYVRPGDRLSSWFLFAYLDHTYETLRAGGRGSNQDALSCGLMKQYPTPVPPLDEQVGIADAMLALEARATAESATLGALAKVKSALMSVLLTGEVRVKPDEEAA